MGWSVRLICLLLTCVATGLGGGPKPAWGAVAEDFLILGVIAYTDEAAGVTLVKEVKTGRTFAARVGTALAPEVTIRGITDKFVFVRVRERVEKIAVGDYVSSGMPAAPILASPSANSGIERQGSVVKVSAALRDHLVREDLTKVLMQAAAVPYYVGSALEGFRLLEIDAGSIYDQAGLLNGDVITAINGQSLTDVGNTVKLLHSLRQETRAEITLQRAGREQRLEIVIE